MKRIDIVLLGLLGLMLCMGPEAFAQNIIIKGSNTFGEELGPRLIRAYRQVHPGVAIELEAKGSASGFAALLAGECDIASSSRIATEDELRLARSRGMAMNHYTVGYYGVAVLVHDANPLRELSDSQVRDIFTGAVTSWKAVGGEDRATHLYIRDPVSGTYLGFQELAMERQPYAESAKQFDSYRKIAEAVKEDPSGIGYGGMHVAAETGLHALRINGMPASTMSVNEGLYPYARLLRFYTNAEGETEEAKRFIRFVQSKAGKAVLQEMGYIPRRRHLFGSPLKIDLW